MGVLLSISSRTDVGKQNSAWPGPLVRGALQLRRSHLSCFCSINRLEALHPVGLSLYRQVLVSVCIRQEIVVGAWAYTGESKQLLSAFYWPKIGHHEALSRADRNISHSMFLLL